MIKNLYGLIKYVIAIGTPIFATFKLVDNSTVLYALVIWLGIALICFNVFTVTDVLTVAHQKSILKGKK